MQRVAFFDYLIKCLTDQTLQNVLEQRTDLKTLTYILYCGRKNVAKSHMINTLVRQVQEMCTKCEERLKESEEREYLQHLNLPEVEQELPLILELQRLINEQ